MQVQVPILIILTKFSNYTESIPQDQWKALFCCSVFHQSIIVYIWPLILGNISTLVYIKKSKQTRILKILNLKEK